MYDRLEDESSCLSCGHRDYGEGFVPLDKDATAQRNRGPMHGGSRL